MSDVLDAVLEHAKRDRHGNVAIAHLRRQEEDTWDALVVGEDRQPLVCWAAGEQPDIKDAVTRDDGSVLMVIASTPPGVRPAGLLTIPADAWGSPLGSLVSLVSQEGITMVSPAGDDRPVPPPPPLGRDMLRSLLAQTAAHEGDGYRATELETADGGTATVLLDWDGRPLMFWVGMSGEEGERELMTAMALPEGDGFVAMAVDTALQPLYSGEATAQRLAEGQRGQAP